jgi:hypothetical protein
VAKVQILYWQNIPAQVKARDDEGDVSAPLPDDFQIAIDTEAMVQGKIGTDAYLEGYDWGPEEERPGSAKETAQAVAEEIAASFDLTPYLPDDGERGPGLQIT